MLYRGSVTRCLSLCHRSSHFAFEDSSEGAGEALEAFFGAEGSAEGGEFGCVVGRDGAGCEAHGCDLGAEVAFAFELEALDASELGEVVVFALEVAGFDGLFEEVSAFFSAGEGDVSAFVFCEVGAAVRGHVPGVATGEVGEFADAVCTEAAAHADVAAEDVAPGVVVVHLFFAAVLVDGAGETGPAVSAVGEGCAVFDGVASEFFEEAEVGRAAGLAGAEEGQDVFDLVQVFVAGAFEGGQGRGVAGFADKGVFFAGQDAVGDAAQGGRGCVAGAGAGDDVFAGLADGGLGQGGVVRGDAGLDDGVDAACLDQEETEGCEGAAAGGVVADLSVGAPG